MTHRIDRAADDHGVRFVFQGHLDPPALASLRAVCQAHLRNGDRVAVVLAAGTEIEPALVDEILEIEGIEITAESPFLSRLLEADADEEDR